MRTLAVINRNIHPITDKFCEQDVNVVLHAQPALHFAVIFAILSEILLFAASVYHSNPPSKKFATP